MPGSNDSFATKDVHFQLHSYADARAHEKKGPLIIGRGDGVFVVDEQGNCDLETLVQRGTAGQILYRSRPAKRPHRAGDRRHRRTLLARFQRSLGETLEWLHSEGA